jgi:hypothetical protein
MTVKKFLSQLELSNHSIKIYLEALNHSFLTHYELQSILPEITDDEFSKIFKELVDADLLIKVEDKGVVLGAEYLAIPPFSLIISYFSNIEQNFSQIKTQIQKIIKKSINKSFEQNSDISLQDVEQAIKAIYKDFEETTMLEKKDVEDIMKEFNKINEIQPKIDELHQKINSITKTQFSKLIKTLSNLRKKVVKTVSNLEMKKDKDKELVMNSIEEIFKAELDDIVEEFISSIEVLINEEFENVSNLVDPYINTILRNKNDVKTILLDLIYNFEKKIKDLSNLIKEKNENLNPNLANLKENVYKRISKIIDASIDEISNLNRPIMNVLSDYLESIYKPETIKKREIWVIHSTTRINEELITAVQNSENELFIIVPKLKDFLPVQIFDDKPKNLKIQIISSDAHVNSKVRQFKEVEGVSFRNLDNEKFIAVGSDKTFVAMGILKPDIENELNNFIGFGTNKMEIIERLYITLNNLWSLGKAEFEKEAREAKPKYASEKKTQPQITSRPSRSDLKKPEKKEKTTPSKATKAPEKIKKTSLSKKARSKSLEPINEGDLTEVGKLINSTFKKLIKNINELNGEQFAKELNKVADIVLEKRGFSVTLHQLRTFINRFEKQEEMLSEEDIDEIIENVETWRQKLL